MITPERCLFHAQELRAMVNLFPQSAERWIERAEAFELLARILRQEPIGIVCEQFNDDGDMFTGISLFDETIEHGTNVYTLPVVSGQVTRE